jgi:hypothetical protein
MYRGDLATALRSMGQLEQMLDELIQTPRKIAVEVAPKITKLLQRQFARGVDPYGRKWRRLATGRAAHLTKTGKLRSGTRAMPGMGGRAGLRVVVGMPYGSFHQTGTSRMPARKILPERGMPAAWREAFVAAARKLTRQATRRVR